MQHPNYSHLLYFWAVVREQGVAGAARELHVTPQTVSGQVKLLEERFRGKLLERRGRGLRPTELGLAVYRYADEIFTAGQELVRVVEGSGPGRQRSVTIGVSDTVPNLVAWRTIAPLMAGEEAFRVVCHTGSLDTLAAELAAHRLDLVLSSAPLPPSSGFRAYSHLLGECAVGFFAAPSLASRVKRGFPASLDQAPFLLPTERSPTRRILDGWFLAKGIRPRVVAEFDDSALIKTFAQGGLGLFAAPAVIAPEVTSRNGMRLVGTTTDLTAKFYALSMERRIRHPAVARLTVGARSDLFG